jgi:hypothetical protein
MTEDQAKARFLTIQMVRLAGYILMFIGVTIYAGKLPLALPRWSGIALGLFGLAQTLILPMVLIKKWRSPPQ